MDIKIYGCDNDYYSETGVNAKFYDRIIKKEDGTKMEVVYVFIPEVKALSDGRLNVMFCENGDREDDKSKWFCYLTEKQKFKVKWTYKDYWIQKWENIWKVLALIISAILGFVFGWLAHQC